MEWGRVRPELFVSGRYNDVVVRRTADLVWKMEALECDGGGVLVQKVDLQDRLDPGQTRKRMLGMLVPVECG